MRKRWRDRVPEDFRPIGTEPYINHRGELVTLVLWEVYCLKCGRAFQWAATSDSAITASKRCGLCLRRAGRPTGRRFRGLSGEEYRPTIALAAPKPAAPVAPVAPAPKPAAAPAPAPAPAPKPEAVLALLSEAWNAEDPLSRKHNARRYAPPVLMHRLGMSRDEVLRLLCDLEARGLVTHEALAPKGARSRVKGYRVASIFD